MEEEETGVMEVEGWSLGFKGTFFTLTRFGGWGAFGRVAG